MPPPPKKKLGDVLVEMGIIDELKLKAALGHQQQWGMSLGQALVERGFCTAKQVLDGLSKLTGHPAIDLDAQALDSKLAFVLPVKSAERLRAVPLRLEGKRGEVLVAAVAAPADLQTLDQILGVARKQRIVANIAEDAAIERAIGRLYYGKTAAPPPPPPPPAQPLSKAVIQDEAELDLEAAPEAPAAPSRPVLVYGWSEQGARALLDILKKGGVPAMLASDDDVLQCTASDVVLCTSLSLMALLPPKQKIPALLVVAGTPGNEDMQSAKALGANVYLTAPLNSEQLIRAIQRGREERRAKL